jgi:hypothetical protein
MAAAEPHFILLTGLGADERLFDAQRVTFPGLVTPRWIAPRPREGLIEYAERFAAEIPIARPLVLGGCSLGGMIAYEMAHVLRPDALVLIASAVTRDAFPLHVRALARIAWIVPPAGYGLGKRTAPVAISLLLGRKSEHRRLVAAMARDASSQFLRWACIAIGKWQPRPLSGVPIYSINGNRDIVLPLGLRGTDYLIPGAGHLLTADQVNAALREIMDRVARDATVPRPAGVDRLAQG